MKKRRLLFVLVVPFCFLLFGILTLPDYGFNSDEPFHFYRGQAYLHFFLTGSRDYKDIEPYPRLDPEKCKDKPDECEVSPPFPNDVSTYQGKDYSYEKAISERYEAEGRKVRRSFFQHDQFTFDEAVNLENGHPPLGGILAALTNHIFYQRLKIMGDIESHHLAEVLISFLGLLIATLFTFRNFGLLASVIASTSIAFYPLFFSESHFNIKDPILASFFAISIVTFYSGITQKIWYKIVFSAVFIGLALGVKFNILFLPFILIPWLLFYILQLVKRGERLDRDSALLVLSLFAYPLVALLIFYALWPYLWPDPIGNIQEIIKFYRTIGTGTPPELNRFIFSGFNTFPVTWIAITTPIPILALTAVGIVSSIVSLLKGRKSIYVLLLLWLFVPILRVTLPNTAIYGGVRQIMEFVYPMGILAGIGASDLIQKLKMKKFLDFGLPVPLNFEKIFMGCFYSLLLALLIYPVIKYHPNQNVYFNELVGGLWGAREKNIPFWGNSYGNAYLQGVKWLNENAEPDAGVGLPIATMANLPKLKLRSDISFNNGYWSGPARGGEYEMEQTYDYPQKNWYSFQYYETYLDPVYEVSVDGVPILKVWKNDRRHTRQGFESEVVYKHEVREMSDGEIVLDLEREIFLTRVTIEHGVEGCSQQKGGYISLSDDGVRWARETEPIDYPQVPPVAVGWDKDTFVFLLPARKTRYIHLDTQLGNPCTLKDSQITVKGLKALPN